MKKIKTLAAFLLAATLLFAAAYTALAIAVIDEDGNIVQENEELPGGIMTLDAEIDLDDDDASFDYVFYLPYYASVSGPVVEFHDTLSDTKIMRVHIDTSFSGADVESYVDFIIDDNTFIMGDAPEIGDEVTGFFDMFAPMRMIYPPQHLAIVIVNRGNDLPRVIVDRFDENWESPFFRLNIDEDTEIVFQDGTPFDGEIEELIGRKLVVEFTISHRDIPETIPNPERVTVLFERAEHPTIDIDWDIIDMNGLYDWDADDIVIISEDFDDPWRQMYAHWDSYGPLESPLGTDRSEFEIIITLVNPDGAPNARGLARGVPNANARAVDSEFPNYLPLRAITEMLGITPGWNDETRQITVQGPRGEIAMSAGSPDYTLLSIDGLDMTHSITLDPPLIFDGRTYVPFAFFREIFGFNNVYFEGGHVHLNNMELMQ